MHFLRPLVIASTLWHGGALAPAAVTGPSWKGPTVIAPATGYAGVQNGLFYAMDCASASYCLGATTDVDVNGYTAPVAYEYKSGTWKNAVYMPNPTDFNFPSGTPNSTDCFVTSGKNVCQVVGSYGFTNNQTKPWMVTSTNGTMKSVTVTLPSDTTTGLQSSTLRSVSCATDVGPTCVAVGTYLDNAGDGSNPNTIPRTFPVAVTTIIPASGSQTATSQKLPLPADRNVNPLVSLAQVNCAAAGECVAVGTYYTRDGQTKGLLETQHLGTWKATAVTPPTTAGQFAATSASEVTCTSAGNCTVVGTYGTKTRAIGAFADSLVAGVWQQAVNLTMPTGTSSNPRVMFFGFAGVSCPTTNFCATGGQYRDAAGNVQGFLINEVGGIWQPATQLSLPSAAQWAGHNGGVVAVTCVAARTCTAAGAYVDAAGNYATGTVSESPTRAWSTMSPLTFPITPGPWSNVNTGGGIYVLTCTSDSACIAAGSVWDGANYQGFALNT